MSLLPCQRETVNPRDPFAVAVLKDEAISFIRAYKSIVTSLASLLHATCLASSLDIPRLSTLLRVCASITHAPRDKISRFLFSRALLTREKSKISYLAKFSRYTLSAYLRVSAHHIPDDLKAHVYIRYTYKWNLRLSAQTRFHLWISSSHGHLLGRIRYMMYACQTQRRAIVTTTPHLPTKFQLYCSLVCMIFSEEYTD